MNASPRPETIFVNTSTHRLNVIALRQTGQLLPKTTRSGPNWSRQWFTTGASPSGVTFAAPALSATPEILQ